MSNTKSGEGKWKGYGLVRDKNGRPKFDDTTNIPQQLWDMLTEDEQQEIQDGRNTRNSDTNPIG